MKHAAVIIVFLMTSFSFAQNHILIDRDHGLLHVSHQSAQTITLKRLAAENQMDWQHVIHLNQKARIKQTVLNGELMLLSGELGDARRPFLTAVDRWGVTRSFVLLPVETVFSVQLNPFGDFVLTVAMDGQMERWTLDAELYGFSRQPLDFKHQAPGREGHDIQPRRPLAYAGDFRDGVDPEEEPPGEDPNGVRIGYTWDVDPEEEPPGEDPNGLVIDLETTNGIVTQWTQTTFVRPLHDPTAILDGILVGSHHSVDPEEEPPGEDPNGVTTQYTGTSKVDPEEEPPGEDPNGITINPNDVNKVDPEEEPPGEDPNGKSAQGGGEKVDPEEEPPGEDPNGKSSQGGEKVDPEEEPPGEDPNG